MDIEYIDAELLETQGAEMALEGMDAVLIPGGFGKRGSEGKIAAVEWARTSKVPFLGICLGMQMAVVEFARNVANVEGANSGEFEAKAEHKVIDLMHEQEDVTDMGGTMRLGAYDCRLMEGSRARAIYGEPDISERHRHRYEFNNDYRDSLQAAGLRLSGLSPDGSLVEMIELDASAHPFFVACQFHPEFKSRPTAPHPLFSSFVEAAVAFKHRDR